jgi:phosphoribosylamine--glycine ligase
LRKYEKVKVLVVGNGGREHALAWKLLQSEGVEQVYCTPGNGGTAILSGCQNLPYGVDDFAGIAEAIALYGINLVVVGPELPLSLGITDYLSQKDILVFGPNQQGAQIEASKSWAKDLMVSAGIPTAKSETFTAIEPALNYLHQQQAPIVVKADGLAAGKGVIVAQTLKEAENAVKSLFQDGFSKLIIEEFLIGQEVSVLAIADGLTIRPLLPAQDHKQIGEGDTGSNTGGMGAYCPTPIATPAMMERVEKEILQPTLTALQKKGIDYRGIIYAGLMITPEGEPKVLEYNCRFGDPETQAVLTLLETPLDEIILACCQQKLEQLPPLKWHSGSSVCVVTAAGGYPGSYTKGKMITGIDLAEKTPAIVFHAGTKLVEDQLLTNGGRVLGVTAIGSTFEEAIALTYKAVSQIHFEDMYYRRDIGHRIMSNY